MVREMDTPNPPTASPKKPGRSSGASPGSDCRCATKSASPACMARGEAGGMSRGTENESGTGKGGARCFDCSSASRCGAGAPAGTECGGRVCQRRVAGTGPANYQNRYNSNTQRWDPETKQKRELQAPQRSAPSSKSGLSESKRVAREVEPKSAWCVRWPCRRYR
eukprot:scaffold18354_cov134-Isochrysis_galbana.AAC.2